MKCSKCGESCKNNQAFCKKCGLPLHILPDFNLIEAELAENIEKVLSTDYELDKNIEELNSVDNIGIEEASDINEVAASELPSQKQSIENKNKRKTIPKKWITAAIAAAIILIAVIIIFVNVTSANKKNTFQYAYEKGVELFEEETYDESLVMLLSAKEMTVLDSEKIKVDELLVEIYGIQDNREEIEKLYFELIDLKPDSSKYYIALIEYYISKEMYVEAQTFINGIRNNTIYKEVRIYGAISPKANFVEGEYDRHIALELTAEEGSTIYYTLDGSLPTSSSSVYTEPIMLEQEGLTAVSAIAVNQKGQISREAVFEYNIQLNTIPAPAAVPVSGKYSKSTKIVVTATINAKIYYTYDGSEPDANSTRYFGPVEMLRGNNVFRAIAISETGIISPIVTNIYELTIDPTISISEGMELLNAYLGPGYKCEHFSTLILNNDEYYIYNAEKGSDLKYFGVDNLTGEIKSLIKNSSGNFNLPG